MKSWIILTAIFCLSCENLEDSSDYPLIQNTWSLSNIINKENSELNYDVNLDSTSIITFLDSGVIICQCFCNSGEGIYAIDNGTLDINCSLTKMKCPIDELMRLESVFLMALNLSINFSISGDTLRIETSGAHDLVFILYPS